MILISNLVHMHTFSTITDKERPEDTHIKLTLRPLANFLNEADSENWDKHFSKLEEVKSAIKKGWLRAIDDPKDKKGKANKKRNDIPESLEGLDDSMKLEIIKGTIEAETLRTWNDEESDKDIKGAIAEQLKLVDSIDKQRAEQRAPALR